MNINEYKNYWITRAKKCQETTVGCAGYDIDKLNQVTKDWIQFFKKYWAALHQEPSCKTLDFGCGIGRFTKYLPGQVLGIDMTQELINIAIRDNPDITFNHYDGENLPYENYSYHNVWSCTVLQHIVIDSVLRKIASEIDRILVRNGRVLLIENTSKLPNAPHIIFRSAQEYCDIFPKNFSWTIFPDKLKSEGQEHSIILGKKF